MAITKEKKVEVVNKLKDIFKSAKSIVFVNFHGLGVEDTRKMRTKLRAEGVGYYVAKKSLAKLALKDAPFKGDPPEFPGELSFAYSDDEISAGREVYEFQKKHEDNITILGGVFENKLIDMIRMTEIAQIPSLQVLRGQFVQIINSPIQQFAVALSQIAESRE